MKASSLAELIFEFVPRRKNANNETALGIHIFLYILHLFDCMQNQRSVGRWGSGVESVH